MLNKKYYILGAILFIFIFGLGFFSWYYKRQESNINSIKAEIYRLENTGFQENKTTSSVKTELTSNLNVSLKEPVRIIVHAGFLDSDEKSADAAFNNIAFDNIYGIESNVQFTKDHIPVITGDEDSVIRAFKKPKNALFEPFLNIKIAHQLLINRLSSKLHITKKISDYTLSELSNYKLLGLYDVLTLDQWIGRLDGKVKLFIIDTTAINSVPSDMDQSEIPKIIQEIISKHNAENFAAIQLSNDKFLNLIDFNKYKTSWNTFEVKKNYKFTFYTLNPAIDVNPEKVSEVNKVGAEVIPVNVSYSGPGNEQKLYASTLLTGSKYIMVDYVADFIKFCKQYNVPVFGQ